MPISTEAVGLQEDWELFLTLKDSRSLIDQETLV